MHYEDKFNRNGEMILLERCSVARTVNNTHYNVSIQSMLLALQLNEKYSSSFGLCKANNGP